MMEKSRDYASRTLILAWLCVAVFAGTLGVIRYWFPERPAGYVGPRALLDAGFALGLLAPQLTGTPATLLQLMDSFEPEFTGVDSSAYCHHVPSKVAL